MPEIASSTPEIFQGKIVETLDGLQGTAVYMDDVIVHGRDMAEHNEHLRRVMEQLESTRLKLNAEKCTLRQRKLHFLGYEIDKDGVQPDPAKVLAISERPPPENIPELKWVWDWWCAATAPQGRLEACGTLLLTAEPRGN